MPYATKSLSLNGSTKYVNLGNVLDFDTDDERTVEIWFKTTATSGYLVSKRGGSTAFLGWGLFVNGSGELEIELCNDFATTTQIDVNTTSTWNDGDWHCAAFTWDGNSSPGAAGLKLYVDGVQQVLNVTTDGLGSNAITNTSDFNVGGRTSGNVLLAGNVAQLKVYDRVLTAAELLASYNGGNPVDPSNLSTVDALLAYLPLGNDDTYPTAYERALDPVVPMEAGIKSTTYQVPNDEVGVEWGRGVGFRDMEAFYPGPGGTFSRFSTKFRPSATYYRMGKINKQAIDDSWSISFWVKYDDTSSTYRQFVTKATDNNRNGNYIVRPHYSSPGQIGVLMRGGNFVGFVEVYTTASSFNDGSWHHVCVTYNGNKQSTGVHIWVDNVDEPLTTVQNSTLLSLLDDSFNIGGYSDNANSINGQMAQVAMYDAALDGTAVAAIYNSAVPNDLSLLASASDLLSWWPIGSEDGDLDRPGTLVNMDSSNSSSTAPGGVLPQSFQFNGSNETISLGDVFNFESDQAFSFSMQVNTSYSGGTQTILSKLDSSFRGYTVEMDSSGVIYVEIASSSSNKIQVYTTSSGHNSGTWKNITVAYTGSGAASGVSLWVDGSLQTLTTGSDTLTTTIVDTADLRFGSRSTGVQYFNGYMTGIMFFATALIGADATAIYNGGTPVDPLTLDKAPYLVGYWPLGLGYSPGTMVGMSGADIQDDAPYSSSLTTEKTWVTTANYDVGGTGQTMDALGKLLILDLKNKLAANGWTVIGSSNTVTYEWQGDTAGPYDVWSSSSDIIWRDSDLGIGPVSWVTLQGPVSPEGQFWITIAWYGSTQEGITIYASNAKPTLPASPLADFPQPSSEQWFWIFDRAQFFNWYNTTTAVRNYFSACVADGSFILGRQTMNESDWNSLTMFHVVDSDFAPADFPMQAVGYGLYWTSWSLTSLENFRCYVPGFPNDIRAVPVVGRYATSTYADNLFTEDSLGGDTPARPVFLVPRNAISGKLAGGHPIVCRVPDLFLSNTTTARGSMAPYEVPYLYTNVEGYMWFPGDTEPSYS